MMICNYPGLSAVDMERRIVLITERAYSTTVNDIEHIESESIEGLGLEKIYFQPATSIGSAIARLTATSLTASSQLPRGTEPLMVLSYSAANVPVAQLNVYSDTLSGQQLFDYGFNFIRVQLFTVPGFSTPAPLGGVQRSVQVSLNPTALYAKTPGYLTAIHVDKGDRVHKGEVLAVLESPALDKQVADAKANYWLQKVTDVRNQKLVAEEVIPQQTADDSHTALLQAKAAYEQLLALQSYEIIRAETDGIITARYVDPGALIPQVTSQGGSTPIVELATLDPLRVYADVPQDIAAFVRDGDPATVTVIQYPGRKFQGTVTRHTQALAPDMRTMRVEVDLPNKDSALYPGMYATVVLNISSTDNVPRVPDDALIFRGDVTYVPVVRNDHIHLAKVTLGNDNGSNVQIACGLSAGNLIALNVGEGVEEGDPVQPVMHTGASLTN
jgi:membrane fusion protein, multidrug efflux system